MTSQIYRLDENPIYCARAHADQHIDMMLRKYLLILSSSFYQKGNSPKSGTRYDLIMSDKQQDSWAALTRGKINESEFPRPETFTNPYMKWVKESKYNYTWLAQVAYALGHEYLVRYKKLHPLDATIDFFFTNTPEHILKVKVLKSTPQPLEVNGCVITNEDGSTNIVESYRNFYIDERGKQYTTWDKGTPKPDWFKTNKL